MDLKKQENICYEIEEDRETKKHRLLRNIFYNLKNLRKLYSQEADENMSLVINNSNNEQLQKYYQKKVSNFNNISLGIKKIKCHLKEKLLSVLYDDNNFDLVKFIEEIN